MQEISRQTEQQAVISAAVTNEFEPTGVSVLLPNDVEGEGGTTMHSTASPHVTLEHRQ
jgi:hypothetical protein